MRKLIYLFLALIIVACSSDDNNNVDDTQAEWLYVHTAIEANATNSTTLVIPFTEDIFAFTDRPNREHKYISADEFVSYWSEDATNSFQFDPPNAVFTSVSDDGVAEVEVVIIGANTDGDNITYTIQNPKLTENATFQDVSLFVDGNPNNNAVYLDANGITVKASAGAVVGDMGLIDGITYTLVDKFQLAYSIEQGNDVTKMVTTLIMDMSYMCNIPTFNQDISSWDVSNVTNMRNMFQGAAAFNKDLSSWSVDNVTSCFGFSSGATSWTVPKPNLPNCEPCSIYLDNNGVTIKACSGAVNGDTGVIDNVRYTVVNEATLRTMIENDSILTNKVTTLVTDMSNMFDGRSTFNQDISSWDVSNVTNMDTMFQYASAFNQDISSWDVSNVTIMRRIFNSATAFNQDISNWDVSNVTTMEYMFYVAQSFNQPIGSWDVSSVTDMSGMFGNATAFNKDLSSWSVDNVNNCNGFSDGASSWILPQPNFTLCTP
jgi:surface protein